MVVKSSATLWPVSGLCTLRHPAEKRQGMSMMRLKSSGQPGF